MDKFNEKETIEKLLGLIEENSHHTEKVTTPKKGEKRKVGHLEKCKMQDLFRDQIPSNMTSPMVSKLSRSLSFLNKPDIPITEKSNNILSLSKSSTEAKKEAFENKTETVSSEVMRNRVQKKIIQSPWSQIPDDNKEVAQKKEIKHWKPKAMPEEPFMKMTGFQKLQQTKIIKSPDIDMLTEEVKDPCPQIKNAFKKFEVRLDDEEDDFEDILNYEDSSEIKAYEKELRARYELDYDSSCNISSDNKSSMKPASSFSSLMNILTTMRKTRLTKSVSACKLNLLRSSETQKPIEAVKNDFEAILTNKERKSNYEKASSCQNSNNDFNNLYYEELEEVRLHRKKKVINITGTNNSMLTYFFRVLTQLQQACLMCLSHGVQLMTWMRK